MQVLAKHLLKWYAKIPCMGVRVRVGEVFPNFSGETHEGKKISLADFRGKKYVVLYFYPKDGTPGCTREAIGFTNRKNEFERAGAVVIGVSVDSAKSHARFCAQHEIAVPLLSDPGGAFAQKLGIRMITGTAARTTFLIDRKGKVAHIWENVRVTGHVEDVLQRVMTLQ